MAAVQPTLHAIEELDGPRGLPIVGSLFDVRFDTVLEGWAEQYGPIYRVQIGPRRLVVLSDPESIKRMFRERPDLFRRTRSLAAATSEMGLNGVFSAEGDNWRRQRKIVALALSAQHLKPFFPKLLQTAERLRRRWERAADAGATVDLCRDLMRFTVDVTTQLAFGLDVNTIETDGPVIQQKLDKIFPMLNWRINAPFPYWRYFKLPKDRELDRALDEVHRQVDRIIADVRARMQADPGLYAQPTNFLEAIRSSRPRSPRSSSSPTPTSSATSAPCCSRARTPPPTRWPGPSTTSSSTRSTSGARARRSTRCSAPTRCRRSWSRRRACRSSRPSIRRPCV
jgi:cytochrome P450